MSRRKYTFDDIPTSTLETLIREYCHNSRYRQVLRDSYIDGLTDEAVAEKQSMSPNGVKLIRLRFGKAFADALKKEPKE